MQLLGVVIFTINVFLIHVFYSKLMIYHLRISPNIKCIMTNLLGLLKVPPWGMLIQGSDDTQLTHPAVWIFKVIFRSLAQEYVTKISVIYSVSKNVT